MDGRAFIHSFIPGERPGVAVCHFSAAGQRVSLKWEHRSESWDIYWLGALAWGTTIQQLPLLSYTKLPLLMCSPPSTQDAAKQLTHYKFMLKQRLEKNAWLVCKSWSDCFNFFFFFKGKISDCHNLFFCFKLLQFWVQTGFIWPFNAFKYKIMMWIRRKGS